jgi:hypothetical protein
VTVPDGDTEAAFVARMDQVLALVREAATNLIDMDRPPGTPVVDPFMYSIGLELLAGGDPDELVELAAGAALLLAEATAERARLETELTLAEGDLDDYRNAGDAVAATRQMANNANAALRAQILGALGEQDDGRTPLTDQLGHLIAEFAQYRRAVAEVRERHSPFTKAGDQWCEACSPMSRGGLMRYVLTPYPCDTIKAIEEAVEP